MNKRLNILWKTKSAKSQSGVKELSSDAGIESHRMSDFFNVSSKFFAQLRNSIGIADLHRQERVGRVLYQFRAVDGGDDEFSVRARRAISFMHRAGESSLQNGPVDFPQFCRGRLILDSHHDAIGVEKIPHRCALSKKFRIGSNVKLNHSAARIGGQGAPQINAGS